MFEQLSDQLASAATGAAPVGGRISDHVWTYKDVAALVDNLPKFQPKKRGPYKKRGEKSEGQPAPL